MGFGSTAISELSYVPAVHGAEDIDNLVDADFRLVLRKLSKRDVVTRLKVSLNFELHYLKKPFYCSLLPDMHNSR